MDSHDSTLIRGPELNIIDQPNNATGEMCPKEHAKRPRRGHFSFLKSHICRLAAIVAGLVVSCVITVRIVSTLNTHGSTVQNETLLDPQVNKTLLLDAHANKTLLDNQVDETLLDPQINTTSPNALCQNFYNFSCQHWIEQNPRPEWIAKWSVYSVLKQNFTKTVLEILEEPFEDDDINGFRQAKDFYTKCLSYFSNKTKYYSLRRHLTMYGMPLVKDTEAGKVELPPTNEFCSQLVKHKFASLLVHKYVMQKYPDMSQFEEIRVEVQQMFDNIKMVFDNARAFEFSALLKNIKVCIGFSDWIRSSERVQLDYDSLILDEDDSFKIQALKIDMWTTRNKMQFLNSINSSNAAECWRDHVEIAHVVGSPVTVFHNNSILIYVPFKMLEPPYFQLHQSKAMKYGTLGFTLGHELAHAYLGLHWTRTTNETSSSLAECLKRQYNTFTVDESISLNGELTLHENLPDNLGLLASYMAYSKLGKNQDYDKNTTSQLTDDQIFFLNFSQKWYESNSKDHLKTVTRVSKHAPGIFRALGTLENSKEFMKSWKCSNQSNNRPQSCQPLLIQKLGSDY